MYQSPIIAIDVNVDGVNITTGAASASAALPNTSAGTKPRYVLVQATVNAHFRVGKGSATATATSTLIAPGAPLVVCVAGADTIAAIQDTAAGVVNVVPLEWA